MRAVKESSQVQCGLELGASRGAHLIDHDDVRTLAADRFGDLRKAGSTALADVPGENSQLLAVGSGRSRYGETGRSFKSIGTACRAKLTRADGSSTP